MEPGKRELKTWWTWLAIGAGMSVLWGALCFIVLRVLSALIYQPFPSPLIGACCVPLFLTGVAAWQEWKAERSRPSYEAGRTPQVSIRNLADGSLIVTVPGASLRGVSFAGVSLRGVCLWGEDLSKAKLYGVDLQHAFLRAAILDEADLRGADLLGADLLNTRLRNADLRGANLSGTSLRSTDLEGALYDDRTRWPTRFLPSERGCIWARSERAELPIPASPGRPETRTLPIPDRAGDGTPVSGAVTANAVEISR